MEARGAHWVPCSGAHATGSWGAVDGSGSVSARTEAASGRAVHAIYQEREVDLPIEQHKVTILMIIIWRLLTQSIGLYYVSHINLI